jgi:hypothetical protein
MSKDTEEESSPTVEDSQTPVITFTRSDSLKSIAPALVSVQENLKNPSKSSKNPHYGNMFAGLDVTMDAAKDACNKSGITILTLPFPAPYGSVGIEVVLLHKSGEFVAGRGYMPVDRDGPQAAGSAITYARRYYVQAVLGMVGEDDDDAESAEGGRSTPKPSAAAPRKSLFGQRK